MNFTADTPPATPPTQAEWAALADQIDAALPQTQCTRCGYPDCRAYAEAVAAGAAEINRCPPGGAEGIARLAELTGLPALPLDNSRGLEGPRLLAVIDEAWCIGCTLCIKACPVDCLALVPGTGERSGWQAWSTPQADQARQRYGAHQQRAARLQREQDDRQVLKAEHKLADLPAHSRHTDPTILSAKRAVIDAALARARARQAERDKP